MRRGSPRGLRGRRTAFRAPAPPPRPTAGFPFRSPPSRRPPFPRRSFPLPARSGTPMRAEIIHQPGRRTGFWYTGGGSRHRRHGGRRASGGGMRVVGVGNILLSDEGIGVHLVAVLSRDDALPGVEYVDGGVMGGALLT